MPIANYTAKCSRADRTQDERPALLVFADDWGRHPSSCQHLVRRLKSHFDVVWANSIGTRRVRADGFTIRRGLEKLKNWRKGLQQVDERMWVVDLPMLPIIGGRFGSAVNRRLVTHRLQSVLWRLGLAKPVVLTTLPYIGRLIRTLPKRALVYYCTDDYSFWPEADRNALQAAERDLCREADLILAVSRALESRLSGMARCHFFPHGVDYKHFSSTRSITAIPDQCARLRGRTIGFFGLIYEKIDFGLLESLARKLSDASLVLVGPVDYCSSSLRQLPNVHLVGAQPYEELPRWLAAMDVLLLPYVDDEMIRQSSPLKLRECLASGKPTVSVDVPEARALQPHVRIAHNPAHFLRHVEEALQEPRNSKCVADRQAAVQNDDWNCRSEQLMQLLGEIASHP